MGSAQSAFDSNAGPTIVIPEGYVTPPFPSLYVPQFWASGPPVGIFLYDAEGIWRFTLYWTIITVCGTFFIASIIASLNLFLSVTVFGRDRASASSMQKGERPITPIPEPYLSTPTPGPALQTTPTPNTARSPHTPHTPSAPLLRKRTKVPPKRPPLWPIALIPVAALLLAGVISLISATVIGFALAAVYSAGGFSMSTWVPFLWSLIQVLVLIVSSYSTLTSIL